MKNICAVTGSRSEYGLLKPIMNSIKRHPSLKLSLIVAGMHLSKEFGHSLKEIIKDGFVVAEKVKMNPKDDTGFSMAQSIGIGVKEMAKALKKINPDILLVLGDRIEALASVIAAAYMNIPIAHIHGGDSTKAGLDESARHAITKFANIHFPATQKSAERILKMGEDKNKIFITGAPCLDTILNTDFLSKKEISKKFNLNIQKPFLLLIQHPVTTESEESEQQIIEILEAIKSLKYQTIIIYPNSDAGGRKIINQIIRYKTLSFIRIYKTLSQKEYLSLLKHAGAMIGNSSSGIIESSSFKLPVVNIGIRQEGRERAGNVIDVRPCKTEILLAIKKALSTDFRKIATKCKNPYGDGKTGQRIARVLSKLKTNKEFLQKKITY